VTNHLLGRYVMCHLRSTSCLRTVLADATFAYGDTRSAEEVRDVRVIEALQRALLVVLVGIPVIVILVDGLLRGLDAQEDNPVVAAIRDTSELLTPDVLTTFFEDQSHWQTVLLALVAYGLVAVVIVVVFSLIERGVLAITTAVRRRSEDGS
jgi:hypothetical protein